MLTRSEIQEIISANSSRPRKEVLSAALAELKEYFVENLSIDPDWARMGFSEFVSQFFDTGLWGGDNKSFEVWPIMSSLFVISNREKAEEITLDLDSISDNTATFHGAVPELDSWNDTESDIIRELRAMLKRQEIEKVAV